MTDDSPDPALPIEQPRGDAVVVAYEDPSPRGQTVVERAVVGETVTIYAPFDAHQGEGGALPPLFTGNWVDSDTVGGAVQYRGQLYEVSTTGGIPFHVGVVVPAGVLVGLLLLALSRATKRSSGVLPYTAALLGIVVLGVILRLANASGYVWPVQ